MRALLINVGHGDATGDLHPRHHVAPMDLAQCAAILEDAGWHTELWDTILTPTASPQEIEGRLRGATFDLLIVLAHTGDASVSLLQGADGRRRRGCHRTSR